MSGSEALEVPAVLDRCAHLENKRSLTYLTPLRYPEVKHGWHAMAKVVWAPGISTVSGALSKINKKKPHAADMQMLLATHRKAATTNTDCNRLYCAVSGL